MRDREIVSECVCVAFLPLWFEKACCHGLTLATGPKEVAALPFL